jgi:hypothetical protein
MSAYVEIITQLATWADVRENWRIGATYGEKRPSLHHRKSRSGSVDSDALPACYTPTITLFVLLPLTSYLSS